VKHNVFFQNQQKIGRKSWNHGLTGIIQTLWICCMGSRQENQ